jgi:hypothetical protein
MPTSTFILRRASPSFNYYRPACFFNFPETWTAPGRYEGLPAVTSPVIGRQQKTGTIMETIELLLAIGVLGMAAPIAAVVIAALWKLFR